MQIKNIIAWLFVGLVMGCGGLKTLPPYEIEDDTGDVPDTTLGDLNISPGQLDFGTVALGESTSESIVFQNLGEDTLSISTLEIDREAGFAIETVLELPLDINGGDESVVTLTFTPDDTGDATAYLVVQVADEETQALIDLAGTGSDGSEDSGGSSGSGEFTVSTSAIDFGVVNVGDTETEDVTLVNNTGDDLLIVDITNAEDVFSYAGVSPPQVISDGAERTITFSYEPDGEEVTSDTFTIETDSAGEYEVTVTGEGYDNTPPTIGADYYTIQLIEKLACDVSTSFNVYNQGGGTLEISEMYVNNDTSNTCGNFTLTWEGATVELESWDSSSLTLDYSATEFCMDVADASTDTNILHVLSNDPSTPDLEIDLTAIALCLFGR